MNIYQRYVLPQLIDFACSRSFIQRQRAQVVPQASGRVLEVGMGSGLNIPFYDRSKVDLVIGLEPSLGMREKAARAVAKAAFPFEWIDLPGEEIPLPDNDVDTVLLTYTLCSIPGWQQAMAQMRRVLKPGGQLIFCEHGESPDPAVRRWQQRINPVWNVLAGGCHLNRPIDRCIESSGFSIERLNNAYLPGPKPMTYHYWGHARPR